MAENSRTRKFLIATHGTLANGLKSSLDVIAGPQDNVFFIQAYLDNIDSIQGELETLLQNKGPQEEWVIFTDLLGGSITNQVVRYASGEYVHIIAGVNLPLLLEMVLSDPAIPVEAVVEDILAKAREQMVYVNKLLQSNNDPDNG
jgi:fructoselysine and glucoselysine-specific PTS system IIA component